MGDYYWTKNPDGREPVPFKKGSFKVVRDCCHVGNCIICIGVTPLGVPTRIVQGDGYSKKYADYVAAGWKQYNAVVERM